MKLASRPLKPTVPRKISAARAETGMLCTPPAALRRTLTVIITPVTFASGAAAPGEGLGQSPAPKAPYTFLAFLDVRIAPAGAGSAHCATAPAQRAPSAQ